MKTTINKIFYVEQPIGVVWDYLADPTKIVSCVPGASLTDKIDDRNFNGKVSLKFGPVKAAYDGKITIEELDVANRKMVLKGAGVDPKGKGSADMEMIGILTEKDGGTEVNYNMEVSLIGMLAQFGSRLVNDVSDQLLNQFVDNFKNKLAAEAPAASSVVKGLNEASANSGESIADRSEDAKKEVAPIAEQVKTAVPPPPPAQKDNSLNAFALMWAVIKGFFSRLFGGGN